MNKGEREREKLGWVERFTQNNPLDIRTEKVFNLIADLRKTYSSNSGGDDDDVVDGNITYSHSLKPHDRNNLFIFGLIISTE